MFDHKANNGNSNFYSRSNSPQNGTIVPEMHNKNAGSNPNDPMRPIGPANHFVNYKILNAEFYTK